MPSSATTFDLRMPRLTMGGAGRADVVRLDPAPEADTAPGIGSPRHADWGLIPFEGPEEASVQARDLGRRRRVQQRARLLSRAAG